MLDYNIAYNVNDKQKVGCLSKSMVEYSENKLTEGKSYLTGFNPKYSPTTDKSDYTFQFICDALKSFNLDKHIPELVEVIVFDALIGNSDRHQENWGFIVNFKATLDAIETGLKNEKMNFIEKTTLKIIRFAMSKSNRTEDSISNLSFQSDFAQCDFSPIYDSGCCLGRENPEEKIIKMLNNHQMIDSYINRGRAEIHWNGKKNKQKHFNLVKLVSKDFETIVKTTIKRINERLTHTKLSSIVNKIDSNLPDELSSYKLSNHRKDLMIKLITLRAEKLNNLF